MPRIALVNTKYCIDACYECSGHTIIESISDWDEVTDQELKTLQRYYSGKILVRDDLKPALEKVRNAVKRAELDAKRHAEAEEAKRKKREEKKRQKEMLANQKNEAEAKKLYEQLRAKFENQMF